MSTALVGLVWYRVVNKEFFSEITKQRHAEHNAINLRESVAEQRCTYPVVNCGPTARERLFEQAFEGGRKATSLRWSLVEYRTTCPDVN